MNLTEKICKSLLVSGLIAFLFFSVSLIIYLGNLQEYSFTILQLLLVTGLCSLGIFVVVFAGFLCFVRFKCFTAVLLVLTSILFCMWLQSNFLLWSSDESTLIQTFSALPVCGIFEILVYILVFYLVFRFQSFVITHLYKLGLIILVSQAVVIIPALLSYDSSNFNRLSNNSEIFSSIHQISKQENIYIILLDSFGNDSFHELYKSEYETTNQTFHDFEYFPHFIAKFPLTFYMVPTLLTGSDLFEKNLKWNPNKDYSHQSMSVKTYFKDKERMYNSENSLLPILAQNGYTNEMYPFCGTSIYFPKDCEWLSNTTLNEDALSRKKVFSCRVLEETILPFTCYRLSPLCLKYWSFQISYQCQQICYNLYSGKGWDSFQTLEFNNFSRFMQQEFVDETPFFTPPEEPQLDSRKYFKLYHLNGWHDLDLEPYSPSSEAYLKFGKAYFSQRLDAFFDYLKRSGSYDSSWIIILGDHGMHLSPAAAQFNPALLIKKPGVHQENILVNEDVVMMSDIAPSLLSELGIKTSKPFSIWRQTEDQKQERGKLWEDFIIKNLPKNTD